MDIKHHTTPAKLERYSFLWSEVRLVIAAVALFLGGVPPITLAVGWGATYGLLKLCWLISGVASGYLLWRWNKEGRTLFGGKNQKDTVAFFVSVISGINLGLTGLIGVNIGMTIASSAFVFLVVGLLYLISMWHLWNRWKAKGEKLF